MIKRKIYLHFIKQKMISKKEMRICICRGSDVASA